MYDFTGLKSLNSGDMRRVYLALKKIMTNVRSKKSINTKISHLSKKLNELNKISQNLSGNDIHNDVPVLNMEDLSYLKNTKQLSQILKSSMPTTRNKLTMYENIVHLGQNMTKITQLSTNHKSMFDTSSDESSSEQLSTIEEEQNKENEKNDLIIVDDDDDGASIDSDEAGVTELMNIPIQINTNPDIIQNDVKIELPPDVPN